MLRSTCLNASADDSCPNRNGSKYGFMKLISRRSSSIRPDESERTSFGPCESAPPESPGKLTRLSSRWSFRRSKRPLKKKVRWTPCDETQQVEAQSYSFSLDEIENIQRRERDRLQRKDAKAYAVHFQTCFDAFVNEMATSDSRGSQIESKATCRDGDVGGRLEPDRSLDSRLLVGIRAGFRGLERHIGQRQRSALFVKTVLLATSRLSRRQRKAKSEEIAEFARERSAPDRYWARVLGMADRIVADEVHKVPG